MTPEQRLYVEIVELNLPALVAEVERLTARLNVSFGANLELVRRVERLTAEAFDAKESEAIHLHLLQDAEADVARLTAELAAARAALSEWHYDDCALADDPNAACNCGNGLDTLEVT